MAVITVMYLVCSIILLITLILFGLYQKFTSPVCKSKKNLHGKVVIVTGGTAGMGLEITTDLAMRGAKVIIACPFEDEGNSAKKVIIEKTGNRNIVFKLLDLACLQSVREFAADVLNTEERLDIVINNAGVGAPGDYQTKDHLQFTMQVNYYGHFLLTLLLLPLLKKTGTFSEPSRIVLVSSDMHLFASTDYEKYNKTGHWNSIRIYSNSKLCLILFAHELSKRLNVSNIVINSSHPGTTATSIFDSYSEGLSQILRFLAKFLIRTPWEGAQTALHVALDEEAGKKSGLYYRNCAVGRPFRRVATDDKLATQLWEESLRLVDFDDREVKRCSGMGS